VRPILGVGMKNIAAVRLRAALVCASLGMSSAYALADNGDANKSCCAKNNECRHVDNQSSCGTSGGSCSGSHGTCCSDACPAS
jgi:hypothetical protein